MRYADGVLPVSTLKIGTGVNEVVLPTSSTVVNRRVQWGALPYGANAATGPVNVDYQDVLTQAHGLSKRLLRDTPAVDAALLSQFSAHVKRWLETHLTPLQKVLSFEEWLESTDYSESRKKELREVQVRLNGRAPTRVQCKKVKSFVKSEFYPEYKAARWINSRSDYFKAYSGPIFKSIEREVFANHHFIKHTPVPDRPRLIEALKMAGRQYVGTDFTSFEALFTPEFMKECECQMYRYMMQKTDPGAAELIEKTLTGLNCISTRAGVRSKVRGRRMSGDMCTSLGNGFSNLMIWDFLYFQKNGNTDYDGFVEGDDGIFAFAGVRPEENDYARLGFIIKITDVVEPGLASFCGIMSTNGNNMRDPRVWLQGFGWTDRYATAGEKIKTELLRAKSLSGAYEMAQCPVIRPICDRMLALTRGSAARFDRDGYHTVPPCELKIPAFAPDGRMRMQFAATFGVSIDTQLALEALVSQGHDDDLLQVSQQLGVHQNVADFMSRFISYCG